VLVVAPVSFASRILSPALSFATPATTMRSPFAIVPGAITMLSLSFETASIRMLSTVSSDFTRQTKSSVCRAKIASSGTTIASFCMPRPISTVA
jgi:hypothetical protein